jgi:hypothetical protein
MVVTAVIATIAINASIMAYSVALGLPIVYPFI